MADFWHEQSLLIDGKLVAAASGAVFDNVNPATEEVIGVVADGSAADMDAVAIANNSRYGLSGGVISASTDRARAVANRVRTGTIMVNGGLYYGADAPFGGAGGTPGGCRYRLLTQPRI